MTRDRTRRKMQALVRQWEASDEPRQAFAQRHGLTVSQFDYWKRLVRQILLSESLPAFAPVRVLTDRDTAVGGTMEWVLTSGERLIIRDSLSPELVRTVVSALRASC
ncbi:MAG: IS66 family insertion sequence element accessory protein TnpA [Vicinamibacterales bacterium]